MTSTKEQAQLSCNAELQCIIITQHLGGVVDGIEFSCNGMLALPPSTNDCQLASSAGSSADLLAVIALEEGLDVGNKSQAFSVESRNSFGVQSPAISVLDDRWQCCFDVEGMIVVLHFDGVTKVAMSSLASSFFVGTCVAT